VDRSDSMAARYRKSIKINAHATSFDLDRCEFLA
jgi:hypothetical protein